MDAKETYNENEVWTLYNRPNLPYGWVDIKDKTFNRSKHEETCIKNRSKRKKKRKSKY